jgi:hypothetical protein
MTFGGVLMSDQLAPSVHVKALVCRMGRNYGVECCSQPLRAELFRMLLLYQPHSGKIKNERKRQVIPQRVSGEIENVEFSSQSERTVSADRGVR